MAILTAFTCLRHPLDSIESLVSDFFEDFYDFNWDETVCLTDIDESNLKSRPMHIVTHLEPYQNTSENIVLSGRKLIQNQIAEAHQNILNGELGKSF